MDSESKNRESLKIDSEIVGNVIIFSPKGRIDGITQELLLTRLLAAMDNGSRAMVIDCQNLTFISSQGLRALLVANKKLRQGGGKMSLCNMSTDIREVFDITQFSTIFSICESRDQSIKDAISQT